MKRFFHRPRQQSRSPGYRLSSVPLGWLLLLCFSVLMAGGIPLLHGLWGEPAVAQSANVQKQEDQVI